MHHLNGWITFSLFYMQLSSKPWSPIPVDTTQNASTATSILTDTLKHSLTYLFIYLLIYNQQRHHGVPWCRIIGTTQHKTSILKIPNNPSIIQGTLPPSLDPSLSCYVLERENKNENSQNGKP